MSEQLTITCPHCSYSRIVPANAIPEGIKQATCPRCKQLFELNAESMQAQTELPPKTPPQPTEVEWSMTPALPQQQPRPRPSTLSFAFNGTAGEYFGIWIVNSLLKIVTVGFYSAWAKVRRRRFFYGSTTLQGEPFDYLADPKTLFKGWLIAAGAFILYSIGTKVSPLLSGIIILIVFIAFPWLLVRSRIFNAVNSSYRNIRFGFRPNYRESYVVFVGLPILLVLTLGLLAPYMIYRQKKFLVENSTYGSMSFSFNARTKDFYILAVKVLLGFLLMLGLIAAIAGLGGIGQVTAAANTGMTAFSKLAFIPVVALPFAYFILMVYGQTALANLCWNGTRMGNGSFRSTLRTRDMALLFITNALAILFSLGLMIPWATVRMVRYRFDNLKLETVESLDEVMAAAGSRGVSATGEEIGDIFDMPIDFAL
ncbi:MAG: DUF898 family protein [Geobacteraceae bacterium]|nr:DUF898 family protein [Geobacteraceae bacterium]